MSTLPFSQGQRGLAFEALSTLGAAVDTISIGLRDDDTRDLCAAQVLLADALNDLFRIMPPGPDGCTRPLAQAVSTFIGEP